MERGFARHERVAALLRRELALLIQNDIKDPRLGPVTVTDVEVTRDLSVARVFVATSQSETLSESLKALKRGAGFLRRRLSGMLNLRSVPELRFSGDDSAEQGDHIDALLKSVLPEPAPDAGDDADTPDDATGQDPTDHPG
ncbi:MAG: 30S ribosome-binding factor RbfA [Pseudomonadota bacterium]